MKIGEETAMQTRRAFHGFNPLVLGFSLFMQAGLARASGGPLPTLTIACSAGATFPLIEIELEEAPSSENRGRALFRKSTAPDSGLLTQLDDCFEADKIRHARALPASLPKSGVLVCGAIKHAYAKVGVKRVARGSTLESNGKGFRLFLWREAAKWVGSLEGPSAPAGKFSCHEVLP